MDFKAIKQAADNLPEAQARELMTRLQARLSAFKTSTSKPAKPEVSCLDDYLTYAIRGIFIKKGQLTEKNATAEITYLMTDIKNYPAKNRIAREWIETNLGNMTEAQKQFIGEWFINLLIVHLDKFPFYREAGIGPYTIMKNINRIPEAVDGELPGYMQKGFIKLLISEKKK